MEGISIIVEGKEDSRFLQDFISINFSYVFPVQNFIEVGGNSSNLNNVQTKIQASTSAGNKNILIFDADDSDYTTTLTKIKQKESELSLKFDYIFLFPDNSSKGNLESLLQSCIPTTNRGLLPCLDQYVQCLNQLNLQNLKKIDSKVKLFIYQDSFNTKGTLKGTSRSYSNEQLWDLKCTETENLKGFLSQILFN